MTDTPEIPTPGLSRRRLVRTAAWATPAVLVASAAPAFAASDVTLPPYQNDGIPRCVGVNFAQYDIYFTAQRNGQNPAAGEKMTFTLLGGLVFDSPYSGTTAVVDIVDGKATPPKFRAPQNGVTEPAAVEASYGGKTESLVLPISGYDAICSLPITI